MIPIKAHQFYSNNEEFFKPKGIISLMNKFYLADVSKAFCRINRYVSLKKICEFDCQVGLEFQLYKNFPKHEASCFGFATIQEIPQQAD